ncbi:hypothetical protein ACVWZD_003029 [Streptomyces sp. TE3672]
MTDSRNDSSDELDLLRRQFDLTWSLFEYHLERLVPDVTWSASVAASQVSSVFGHR